MKKIITICDYCEKVIETRPKFIQTGTEVDEDAYTQDEKDFRLDLCDDCFGAISSVLSTLILERRKDKEQSAPDQEDEGAALEQQDAAEKQQAPEKKQAAAPTRQVDHGRIVALYTANPPRSIKWIADDCKCSEQTVINHLKKEGLYKTLQGQKEEKNRRKKNEQ